MRNLIFLTCVFIPALAIAGEEDFQPGAAIPEFGPISMIEGAQAIPEGAQFKIRFDTAKAAEPGALNRTLTSAARFINMHDAAGVSLDAIKLAVVIHGGAVKDVTNSSRYAEETDIKNANAALVAALQDRGVEIFVCGQSAAYYNVATDDLLPGVHMALSAMTAHALLDAQGYSLNPF